MDTRRVVSPESALASDIFDKFCSANTLKGILSQYRQLCCVLRIKPTHFPDFYPRLRAKLCSWRAQGLWSKFEKRASQKCYGRGKACHGTRVLIIGAGPCGLRAAIEAQLLGAKVVLIEKRDRFSRNNVLHLWPFVITDLKALGAKKFYGKFCAGSIDHISIRQLQCILLKVALLLGVEVHEGVGFEGLREPTENEGWRPVTSPEDHPVCHYTFDVLIGADGRRNTLDGFKRKALRAKLAIAITANFINKHTEAEARVKEISGVSYIFNQKFFQDLCEATGIDLENIVYYKDETHYFVMTAKKQSLLAKGVLLHDYADTAKLLSHENISSEALMIYALEAAMFATEYQLPDIEFAVNHYGQPDVAMFDFTAMYAAENACRVVQRKGHKLLMTLVGDSLLEPFWPTGSGCARGFLSSFDASWMLRSWTSGIKSVLEVIAERESIYRLLGQTTPENLQKEHVAYSIDPHTRYPNLNLRLVMPFQVKTLYDADEKIPDIPDAGSEQPVDADKAPKKRRRDSVIAVDSLLSWLRDQVTCHGLEINDVKDAFVRGDVLCAIVHRFRPDLIEYPLPSEENVDPLISAAFGNQLAFDILHQEYGLPHVMSGFDSVQLVSSDILTLVAYLSQVYEIFRGEIPQTKYMRSESGDELEDTQHRINHLHSMKELRMAVTAKHHFSQKSAGRRSRLSSSKDSRGDGDSNEPYRRKKRRSDGRVGSGGDGGLYSSDASSVKKPSKENRKLQDRVFDAERYMKSMRLLQLSQRQCSIDEVDDAEDEAFHDYTFFLYRQTVPDFDERCKKLEQKLAGREIKTVFGKTFGDGQDCEKMVPGMAKDLEAKLKGRPMDKQKPKDLIRAIGKIEKSDWNVQLIEKKIAEMKDSSLGKKDRDSKVPRWSREAFDDKREAMKRKMDGGAGGSDKDNDKVQLFDETVKKIGIKLKEGNALEVGQRGCNKVSAMAEQLVHKLERPKQYEVSASKQTNARPVFELPKKGRIELCHFCKERVYVVERMTAEGKFFHRNCFRCEYCNTSLRIGNYVFDREGRYGERFYCAPHYATVRMYGWKKFEVDRPEECPDKYPNEVHNLLVPPVSQQILEMDERGTTPERVEFENSVDFASEEELLNEMDEDEWTDRNFGASNADNTSDEASDLSDDEEVTPDGNKDGENNKVPPVVTVSPEQGIIEQVKKEAESSDSDTEVASEEDEDEEGSYEEEGDEDEEDEDDEYEEECGGSTTEIETDSEFAEDPPHSVPGSIPTIVVDAPEQLVTRLVDVSPINHTRNAHPVKDFKNPDKAGVHSHQRKYKDLHLRDLDDISIELVKKGGPERQLPVVTPVPKKWEPLFNNPERLASKTSLELKKKYLHGGSVSPIGISSKKPTDPAAQNQFRSVLDMISEQQKLLQPAAKPSATMQAFLDGAEKLKNKSSVVPLNRNLESIQVYNVNIGSEANEKSKQFVENTPSKAQVGQIDNGNIQSTVEKSKDNNEVNEEKSDISKSRRSSIPSKSDIPEIDLKKTESKDKNEENQVSIDDMEFTVTITAASNEHLTDTNDTGLHIENAEDKNNALIMIAEGASLSQSETTETRSTVINVNNAHLHNPSIANAELASDDDEVGESGSDTEVGSGGDHLSDLDDMDFDDAPPRVVREPPRVEIEDEFGVTQALEIAPDKLKNQTFTDEKKAPKSAKVAQIEIDDDFSEGNAYSSSESSLNAGIFLETEMSDYVKEEESNAENKLASKRRKNATKKSPGKRKEKISQDAKQEKSETVEKSLKIKPNNMGFDLEALDFADIDGISSPEDGHADIAADMALRSEDLEENHHLSSVLANAKDSLDLFQSLPDEGQSTPVTDSSSDDEDRSSTSGKDFHDQSTSEADVSENLKDRLKENICDLPRISVSSSDKTQGEFPSLERVGPFSSARDSLDYRKTKGATSHLKNKDLYSTYSVPSAAGPNKKLFHDPSRLLKEEEEHALTMDQTSHCDHDPPIMFTSSDESNRSTGSPGTARRLHQIHQDRVKQNDLIRSMVMGRIRKSPEKGTRRNSKGSSSGTSVHSEATIDKSGDEGDSRQSSDNSQCQDGNTSEEYIDEVKPKNSLKSHSTESCEKPSSSDDSSGNDIPHRPMAESVTSNSDDSSAERSAKVLLSPQKSHQNYEPVFTSSPRFRNRPMFNGQLTIGQSVTEPPTPTSLIQQPSYDTTIKIVDAEKFQGINSVRNPLFYRSMPNLANFVVPNRNHPIPIQTTTIPEQVTNQMREMNLNKSSNSGKIEKSRIVEVVRPTGLDVREYIKQEGNRKAESDRESENRKKILMRRSVEFEDSLSKKEKYRPRSEMLDKPQHGSVQYEVSSHGQKFNPFLVPSPDLPEILVYKKEAQISEQGVFDNAEEPQDDFINLHLRFKSKDRPSDRRVSPEKSKSVCTESLKEYVDSGYFQSVPSYSSMIPQTYYGEKSSPPGQGNWILEKHEPSGRPRAHTLADLHFKESQLHNSQRVSFIDPNNSHRQVRHSIDNSDTTGKSSKSKALSSDTLLDASPLSENTGRGTSVPDISNSNGNGKVRKGKDRDRRRSLIQAVSDFFTIRTPNAPEKSPNGGTGQSSSLTTSTSSSSIVSPNKDRFSLFKLTPKLLQSKEKKSASKSKDSVLSPTSNQQRSSKYGDDSSIDSFGRPKTDFSAYFAQPNLVIQRLSSSPNPSKSDRSGPTDSTANSELDTCAQNMATLSVVANSTRDSMQHSKMASMKNTLDSRRAESKRAREIEEIQLQLESIEADQRALETRGVKIEKKLRGEEPDEENRSDNEIMEDWFALVREKTRLARFEKELLVRAQELELEARREQLVDQLEKSLSIDESDKSSQDKQKEQDILHDLRRLDEQHGNLLNSIHADMEKYKSEDSNAECSLSPGNSRLESDV